MSLQPEVSSSRCSSPVQEGYWSPALLLDSTLPVSCLVAEQQHPGGLLPQGFGMGYSLFLSSSLGLPLASYFSVFGSLLSKQLALSV